MSDGKKYVWIVTASYKYSDQIIGVFSTEERANEYWQIHKDDGDMEGNVLKHAVDVTEEERCNCGGFATEHPSECPYAEEIWGCEKICNCCDGCREQCAMDI